MTVAWIGKDVHEDERKRKLKQGQPLLWRDYLPWLFCAGLIAGVLIIAKAW